MPLWVIHRANDRFRQGTYFEESDWGVQEAVIAQKGNQITVEDTKGFILPVDEIKPYAIRIQKRGLHREGRDVIPRRKRQ
jgi:hypothetical protein